METAHADLPEWMVEDALIQATLDSYGDEALKITVVLPSTDRPKVDGRAFNQFLTDLHYRLEAEGEPRRPIPAYMTREELAAYDEPEP